MKYRKKPVVIDAHQLPFDNVLPPDFWDWADEVGFKNWSYVVNIPGINIITLEGTMRADPGDWVIKGVKGEFYPCKPDIFDSTYELAGEEE